jgi:transcription elongation GreA/GreB family factor
MTITKEVFQYLINHIRELQDKKISIVNVFALDYDEFMTMLDLVNADIKRIENYLDNARIGTDQHALPFVIIGSVVHVIEQKDGKVYKYRINLPDKKPSNTNVNADIQNVSCISLIGRALLLGI